MYNCGAVEGDVKFNIYNVQYMLRWVRLETNLISIRSSIFFSQFSFWRRKIQEWNFNDIKIFKCQFMLGLALDWKLLSHQRLFSVFWASEWLFYDSYHRQSQVNEKSDFYHENQKLTYSLTCLCDTIVDYLSCVCVCSCVVTSYK